MDDGVAYMVMGEGDMSQATQMVAIDNGDGTQQYAIPVMDPETGQETYMIIDPQTAQVGHVHIVMFCKITHSVYDYTYTSHFATHEKLLQSQQR